MKTPTPVLAIVGRPNVGKSTLFNRVFGSKRAIVEDLPGVTRDRNYALVESYAVPFYLVDTGGFEKKPEDVLQAKVTEQALLAIDEADAILAVFDLKTGVHADDTELLHILRPVNKPVYYLVNKCDGKEQETMAAEFYSLGISELHTVSAAHGRGVTDLIERILPELPGYQALLDDRKAQQVREQLALEELRAELPDDEFDDDDDDDSDVEAFEASSFEEEEPRFAPVYLPDETSDEAQYIKEHRLRQTPGKFVPVQEEEAFEAPESVTEAVQAALPDRITVAIIGRPNAGKSTLLNTLVGEERAITSPIAGTTRDSLYFPVKRNGQEFELIDTAGLRKKGKVSNKIEQYSALRSLSAIAECDVAVVLIDGVEGPSEQDAKIVGLAHDEGKGIILVINKWDLVEKDYKTVTAYRDKVLEAFKFVPYAPMLFVSAKTGKRCVKILDVAREIALERLKVVPTAQLNSIFRAAQTKVNSPSFRGRPVKLYFAAQVASAPPRFVLFFNYPKQVHFSYLRFFKNTLRKRFGFEGTDIKFVLRKR